MWFHYFVGFVAKESSSPADLVSKLVEFGFSSSADTRSFAQEIYAKVPHKQSGLSVSPFCKILCGLNFVYLCP